MVMVIVGVLVGQGAVAAVVVNEIHFDPPVKTDPAEFIELYNPGAEAMSLSGWRIRGGVAFTFPEGAVLPAGGYGVVAQDPGYVERTWGVTAWGPWSGRLANRGERVDLEDAGGARVDRVEYRLGFPWPTVGEAPGYSIELIRPDLNNNHPGHWRASVGQGAVGTQRETLIEPQSVWRFWRGRTEASQPVTAWRGLDFSDAAWETGALPIGYDPGIGLGTRLEDMSGGYRAVMLRRTVHLAEASSVTELEVEALYDDGFRMWINGQAMLNVDLPLGELSVNSQATGAREDNGYHLFRVSVPVGLLQEGENLVAVQFHNVSLGGSSDAFFDARLVAVRGPSGVGPTPGRANSVLAEKVPPAVGGVEHHPREPRSGEAVVIQAWVEDGDGVEEVRLGVQVVEPGAYVEMGDAEYGTRWEWRGMRDDGTGGDARAGDGVFTAVLEAGLQRHRRLVRYRVEARDSGGATVRVPYAEDPQGNFAYYVYDGAPDWTGSVRPGAGGEAGRVFTVPAEEMNRLPILHLLARRSAVEDATWFSRYGGDAYPWTGTLVFRGRVYDHIRYRARGGVWRYAMGKNMWKFDFLRGHDFEAVDDWGRPLDVGWTKLNLGASIQQGDFEHRGEQGLFESVGYRMFRLAGVPAMETAYAQLRVVDEAEEAPVGRQYDGDFWGVYLMLEQPDGRFLDQHGLPEGNLYKMENGFGELNHLGPAGPADASDLRAFLDGYNGASEDWWRANFEIDNYLSYQTVVQAIHHYDICYDKNFFYYRNPEHGRWQVIPWDLDLTWAENMYDAGCGGVDRIKQRLLPDARRFPEVWRSWQNRIREFRDLFWNQDEAGRLIDEQVRLLRGTRVGATVLDADRAQWDYNPRMMDPAYSTSPSSKAGWGRFYQWPLYSGAEVPRHFGGAAALMKRYVGFRATNSAARARSLDALAADASLPVRPTVRYVGWDGYPVDGLRFEVTAPEGPRPISELRWRVGAIGLPEVGVDGVGEPERYELEAVWESGPRSVNDLTVEIPAGALRVGQTYRLRAQYRDVEGRASHWSMPIQFTAGRATGPVGLQADLRLTEIMYHAPEGPEWDYLELHNRGNRELDVGGVSFVEGIEYTFPAGTRLGPGGYLIVARADPEPGWAAFRDHYELGPEVAVYGPYLGNLSNAGERLVAVASDGVTRVLDVTYRDTEDWPLAADGAGHSLVPKVDPGPGPNAVLDLGSHWRASAWRRGSPGRVDSEPETPWVISEVGMGASGGWIEMHRPYAAPFRAGPGWYLSVDRTDLRQWSVPESTVLEGEGWQVWDGSALSAEGGRNGLVLMAEGGTLWLSSFPSGTEGRVVDAVSWSGLVTNRSISRPGWPAPGGAWQPGTPPTPGALNQPPIDLVGVSEVFFHPPGDEVAGVDANDLEFVELHHRGATPVDLGAEAMGWRIAGGVQRWFPPDTILASGERLVVVSFDPWLDLGRLAAFRSFHGITDAVRLDGPYEGRLHNDTDRIRLEQRIPVVGGEGVWSLVDQVVYFDRDPWPAGADGEGGSLHRRAAQRPGTDPQVWRVAVATPGQGAPGDEADPDTDGDGLPDSWERAMGMDPGLAMDGWLDIDGDGHDALEEFLAGTDPREAGDFLGWETIQRVEDGRMEVLWRGRKGRGYVVEARAVDGGPWQVIHRQEPVGQDLDLRILLPATLTLDTKFRLRLR